MTNGAGCILTAVVFEVIVCSLSDHWSTGAQGHRMTLFLQSAHFSLYLILLHAKGFLQTSSNLSSCLMTYVERCSLSAHQPSRKQERRQKLLPEPTRLNRYCFRQKLHFLAACCSKRSQEIIRNWGLKDLKACTGHCDNS